MATSFLSRACSLLCFLFTHFIVFSQANTALSNLAVTEVNTDLRPGSSNARNLGTAARTWKDLYLGNVFYLRGSPFLTSTSSATLQNTGIGHFSLAGNSTGYNNTGIGAYALRANTIGYNNVAVGYTSLFKSPNGHNNVAVGVASMYNTTSGVSNSAFGNSALTKNTTGSNNMAIGANALGTNTTGSANIAIGVRALFNNQNIDHNIAIGDSALFSQQTLPYNTFPNLAIGPKSLYSNTSGTSNLAIGYNALFFNQSGMNNIAIGAVALESSTSGSNNTAIGFHAMALNTTGLFNTAVGYAAMGQSAEGKENTALGNAALSASGGPASSYNTAIGAHALEGTSNSAYNTAIGYYAAADRDLGYNNTIIGANTSMVYDGLYNCVAIGQGVVNTGNSQARIGNSATVSIGGYASWSNFSDGRFKKNIREDVIGMRFIRKLRPVTYTLDVTGINNYFGGGRKPVANGTNTSQSNPAAEKAVSEKEKIIWSGFVAQEVEKAAKESGYDFSGVDLPKNKSDLYSLRYADFVVPLVKAVQELSDSNELRKKQIDSLAEKTREIDSLKIRLARIEALLLTGYTTGVAQTEASVFQNIPNPASGSTTIRYKLPRSYSRAKIIITDMSGRILQTLPVSGSGDGMLTVSTRTLAAGVYPYTLYADGTMIGSRQMLVVK